MALELIVEGTGTTFLRCVEAVERFNAGDKGEFHLQLSFTDSGLVSRIAEFFTDFFQRRPNTVLTGPVSVLDGRTLVFPFEKADRAFSLVGLTPEEEMLLESLSRRIDGCKVFKGSGFLSGLLGGLDGKALLILGGIALLAFSSSGDSEPAAPKSRRMLPDRKTAVGAGVRDGL